MRYNMCIFSVAIVLQVGGRERNWREGAEMAEKTQSHHSEDGSCSQFESSV